MTYKKALKEAKRTGTARATGDGLRAMYAGLVALQHGGSEESYYKWLQSFDTDTKIAVASRELLRERRKAYDVLLGVEK